MVAVLLGVALAGCGRSGDEREARRATQTLYTSLAAGHPAAACATLSTATAQKLEQQEKKSCPKAIGSVSLPHAQAERVEVWGTSALVRLSGGDLAFLDHTNSGWRVSAAGCKPQGDQPADCELED
jgi:hypothetical protein